MIGALAGQDRQYHQQDQVRREVAIVKAAGDSEETRQQQRDGIGRLDQFAKHGDGKDDEQQYQGEFYSGL
jgi:hypothetical protein